MQLFYNENIEPHTRLLTFSKEESRHIIRVLRKKEGDKIFITNGKDHLFTTRIINASDKKCSVEILKSEKKEKTWNYYLHVAIAPTKSNERMEWFLEKATEIGIDEITPILCDNSERKIIKEERLQKVIISSVKQSLKFRVPKLNPLTKYNDLIQNNFNGKKLIAYCEYTQKNNFKELIKPQENILILIGPEGDFSHKEIDLALQHKFIPLSLGESRLRTETAGIVVCNSVSLINS